MDIKAFELDDYLFQRRRLRTAEHAEAKELSI